MIKRDITETVYEYDKEGKLVKKTVIETHEEENNTVTTFPSWSQLNGFEAVPYNLADKIRYGDSNSTLATQSTSVTTTNN
jgi:hypothetical protein